MLGRIKRQQKRREQAQDDTPSIHGVGSLIGGSGVSLDGQSLLLPDENTMQFGDGDEVSSIATSNYGGRRQSSFRIVGPAVEEPSVPPVPTDAETGVPATNGDDDGSPGMSEKVSDTRNGRAACCAGGCLPRWLSDSPFWVKSVIILGLALLVGAAVLVAVAAGMASENKNNSTGGSGSSATVGADDGVGGATTSEPTVASAAAPPTMAPSISLKPSVMPFPGQTPSPTDMPSIAPTGATGVPTGEDSALPSDVATQTPTEDPGPSTNIVTFYATAGRFQGSDLTDLQGGLPNLPTDSGNSFMVHLGDWNSPFATSCSEQSYLDNEALYSTSSVPVMFVPGDNEYNDCPDPAAALTLWHDTLLDFETSNSDWQLPFTLSRQEPDYPENFAFLYENILFVGINLVGGTIQDANEWATRQAADLAWIDSNVEANRGRMYWLVLFAHADPDIQSSEPFYTPFFDRVKDSYGGVPVLLIHRNLGIESSGYEPNFQGIAGLTVLVVEGSIWPPMKIELNAAGDIFTFDQANWYADEVGL
jgi:hypothetical protein